MEPILSVKNLKYVYSAGTPFEHTALEDVSFSVNRGEFIGIIGHTGSGKSTLMQQLNGLLKPTSGSVILDGQDIWSDKKLTRQARFRVGLVFQYPEYQLFEETVYKDIAFGPGNMELPKPSVWWCCTRERLPPTEPQRKCSVRWSCSTALALRHRRRWSSVMN